MFVMMIKMMKKILKNETFLYLFFGCWTTIVNYGVFYIFYNVIGLRSVFANFHAFVAALAFSFITNKIVVFKSISFSAKKLCREITQYSSSRIMTFFIEEIGLWACEEVLYMRDVKIGVLFGVAIDGVMLGKFLLAVVVVIINYIICKLLVFKRKENNE